MKILVTGSAGFIAGYLVQELLAAGHEVVGLDNFSKYGPVERVYGSTPNYLGVVGDAKDVELLKRLLADCEHFVAGAAIIGGISLFHERAYDLFAENERITASAFDAAIWAHRNAKLKKITVVSSSMVYESTDVYPTTEGEQRRSPPPRSTYGFQKLATEYFAQGAYEQYRLPYTICRPFNCIGVGESAHDIRTASAVWQHRIGHEPRRARPCAESAQGSESTPHIGRRQPGAPLHVRRRSCPRHSLGDRVARGDQRGLQPLDRRVENRARIGGANLEKIRANDPFHYVSDRPYSYDVRKRIPSVEKAKRVLGFEATTSLSEALDEIIPWIRAQIEIGGI